jgi:hypothetical protein
MIRERAKQRSFSANDSVKKIAADRKRRVDQWSFYPLLVIFFYNECDYHADNGCPNPALGSVAWAAIS